MVNTSKRIALAILLLLAGTSAVFAENSEKFNVLKSFAPTKSVGRLRFGLLDITSLSETLNLPEFKIGDLMKESGIEIEVCAFDSASPPTIGITKAGSTNYSWTIPRAVAKSASITIDGVEYSFMDMGPDLATTLNMLENIDLNEPEYALIMNINPDFAAVFDLLTHMDPVIVEITPDYAKALAHAQSLSLSMGEFQMSLTRDELAAMQNWLKRGDIQLAN